MATPETKAPSNDQRALQDIGADYLEKFGFHDSESGYAYKSPKGLSEQVVRDISGYKSEPDWMLEFRLKALEHFRARPTPRWGGNLGQIDWENIHYFVRASEKNSRSWDDVPDDIKKTFDKLGIPEAERKFLAGVGAQYESEVVYHQVREDLEKQGVIFVDMDSGLREHPDLVKEYFGTVIPADDNKFAALNSAVWSGGSFVYVPTGVKVDMPLQAYFRINAENMGQFERTLIIAEEGSDVHYVEGCTAPVYSTDSLHSAVVEIIAKPGAKVRYTTIQNWSTNVYNLVTKRAWPRKARPMEWVDGNLGSKVTMKYPAVYLLGARAQGEILSVAFAGPGQPRTRAARSSTSPRTRPATITSKSISKDGGRGAYRGLLKVAKGATERGSSCAATRSCWRAESKRHVPVDRDRRRARRHRPRGIGRRRSRTSSCSTCRAAGLSEDRSQDHDRQRLLRAVHQGAADGVRGRVEPPARAANGRLDRLVGGPGTPLAMSAVGGRAKHCPPPASSPETRLVSPTDRHRARLAHRAAPQGRRARV